MSITEPHPEATTTSGTRHELMQERATLVALLESQTASLPVERSDVPDGRGETETLATAQAHELTVRVSALTQAAIDDIDEALSRLEDGAYGICQTCNGAIPLERLKVIPSAIHCVQCQGARESASS